VFLLTHLALVEEKMYSIRRRSLYGEPIFSIYPVTES